MLKKTISYEDFNGNEVTEDHYFHLSKAEMVELELSHQGGLSASLQAIIDAEDGKQIIAEFKNIILGAYGKRSPDGRRFIKNQELRDEFQSTEAYSTLFMELVVNAEAAAAFINGVIPQNMAEEVAKLAERAPALAVAPEKEVEEISRAVLMTMPKEEFSAAQERIAAGDAVLVD